MSDLAVFDEFDKEERGGLALDDREFLFLTRIERIWTWLARHPLKEVRRLCVDELGLSEPQVTPWIQKAEDVMSMTVLTSAERYRKMYFLQLQEIRAKAMAYAVRDMVEITTKPTRVQDESGKRKIINGQHTKIKPGAFDAAALQLAMKAAEKAAQLMGVKTATPPIQNQFNVQINNAEVPGAQELQDLTSAELARLAGYDDVIDVVQGDAIVDFAHDHHDPPTDHHDPPTKKGDPNGEEEEAR